MNQATRFLLDSGDPTEYAEIAALAQKQNQVLWGATTNPTLIAKSASRRIAGKKITSKEAFQLQKEIVLEIIDIVPGAVSAEVYADAETPATEMIEQGKDIATWHKRVVVKLPTTIEGFKARTALRKQKIMTNNTLVFSQQQIFAICLHEYIIQKQYGPLDDMWPPFISPFVGRLDDSKQDGMQLVEHGMKLPKLFHLSLPKTTLAIWMLEASVRQLNHMKRGIDAKVELITAPASLYREWFGLPAKQQEAMQATAYAQHLALVHLWTPNQSLLLLETEDAFFDALTNGTLDITHPLTEKGIAQFANDWKAILQ